MPTARLLLRRTLRILGLLLAAFLLASVTLVGLLRVINPPVSAFMLRHALLARLDGNLGRPQLGAFVPLERMSPELPLAVVAAEDQRFLLHNGFDLTELGRAWTQHRAGRRLRGASTISQQTAKNLFLWPGRDWLRKGLEAWFTLLIETLWPKARILEVYLNIAQFGPDTYGVAAASRHYFDRTPADLNRTQAALLAAALPNPRLYRVASPSPRMQRRAAWIARQMRQLGGPAYLREL